MAGNAISAKPINSLWRIVVKTNKIRKAIEQSVSIFFLIFATTFDKIQIGKDKLGSHDHRGLHGLKSNQGFQR